ncbi:MAG: hydroxyacid dehydrogenase [Kiritimatiellae bacterium]|jgi:D-lactate dehydrogenase|nr:hydroxyacid dehydrogenase [Kiritimatiellia bacterium]NLD90183.1 hydroxyacid dehydrogenase [Lentisphaerota bacterium]HPC19912.1 NAD(P)-dependent oxidoreductase [Kiritimatiellia bacterium]HQN80373.1 NAD(P)-dependent oxidoreductase [Kiritimatiellia bacterium]
MTAPNIPEEDLSVFFYEAFAEEAERLSHYAAEAGLRIGHTSQTIQEAGHHAPPAAIISLRTQSILPREWAARLGGILSRSTGYDHLLAYREANGSACPPLGYLPLYCVRAVAEQALLLWTALLRYLPRQLAQFDSFRRDHLSGRENPGKIMALFGVGNIGYEIWRIASALGLIVHGVDPVRRHADVAYTTPEAALADADIIVCAMNLTPTNRGYFTAERLAQARRQPILVNIARGEFTPAAVLEQALASGLLAGVALDVYNEESTLAPALRAGNPAALTDDNHALLRLRGRPDVLLTPHNAFNTREAVERKSEQSIRTLLHFRKTCQFLWPVPAE